MTSIGRPRVSVRTRQPGRAGLGGRYIESSDDEEISDEEMVHSYKVMYKRLVEALNEN